MNLFTWKARRAHSQSRKRNPVRLGVEIYEDRLLLSIFTVTNNTDGGPGSLRQATLDANGNPGADTIDFNIAVGAIGDTTIPTASSNPQGITEGPDGNVWFTEFAGNKIGRITPAGTINEFAVPTPNSGPVAITNGPDGNLWFIEATGNKIGRITPAGTISEFAIPTPSSAPEDITNGPDGNLWFTEAAGNKIGRITPAGTINEFAVPTPNSGPDEITNGPDGNLWFTEGGGNKIAMITPAGTISEFVIPTPSSAPEDITPGPDGNLWFTEFSGNKIGRITPAGAVTGEFPIPTPNSNPNEITTGPDGDLWFTEATGNKVGRITPAGAVTGEFPIPTSSSSPQGITTGPDNNVWFIEAASSKIGRVTVSSTGLTISPQSPLTLTGQVVIDGTTEPGIVIDGSGLAQDGFKLGAGSGGSTIEGLTVQHFAGAAIHILSNNNTIQQDVLGASGLGNQVGVLIEGGSNNLVGGAGVGNTIGFNTIAGISISGAAATGNLILGNYIGTSASNPSPNLGNVAGVVINGSPSNSIGGTSLGDPNLIAFNASAAVSISGATATGDVIRQNSVFANGSGIVLVNGGNAGQPAPTLTAADSFPGTTMVEGRLVGFAPNTMFTVEFFASTPGDPSTPGQAHVFLGSNTFTTDSSGTATISSSLAATVPVGQVVTATATSPAGNTSQFANGVKVISGFVVTNTNDSGIGSLRQVVLNANANPGSDPILFNIPSGPFTISPASPLPTITDPVFLDGTSQPGYAGAPIIQINGLTHTLTGDGLTLGTNSDGSRVRGLDIYGFAGGAGIHVLSNNNVVQNNYLGTDALGTTAQPDQVGLLIDNSAGNTIGGLAAVGNLISGNTGAGVSISGTSATSNVIQANRIGTNAPGTAGLANSIGIVIDAGSNNSIGGASTTRGNTIAFNTSTGVLVSNNGVGNLIRGNPIYANTVSGITLQSGGNTQLPPPVVNLATSGGSTTTVQFNTAGLTAGSVLEFFTSLTGDPSSNDQAHAFLGSYTIVASDLLSSVKSVTFSIGTQFGLFVIATDTTPANNTSPFSTRTEVFNPFVVTTTSDNGDNVSPIAGSLRAAIINTNNNPGTDTISFAIPGAGTHTLTLFNNIPLPSITDSVVIDATSQSGYNGSPLIRLDGGSAVDFGLVLAPGSSNSTILGLNIVRFASAGIQVQSDGDSIRGNYIGTDFNGTNAIPTLANALGVSVLGANNVIGGTSGLSANRIAFNTGGGVTVDTGSGNAIRGNSIFSNGSAQITLTNGGNLNQPAPGLTAAASSAGTTVVTGSLDPARGFAANTTYVLDFYASAPGDPAGPQAHIYLGSFSVTTGASGVTPFTASVPTSVSPGVTITATATSPANNTSVLTTPPVTVASPFNVTTTADNGNDQSPTAGSLRAAIISANSSPGPDTITFAISTGPFTITLAGPLPSISDPLVIDGTTQAGIDFNDPTTFVRINGNNLSGNGITLAAGSDGSAIRGLQITNFNGDAIQILSSGNTIGGIATGQGNRIANNAGQGVHVVSGAANQIRQNLIFGSGAGIKLEAGTNNSQTSPTVTAFTTVLSLTTIDGSISGTTSGTYVIEFFASSTTAGTSPAFQFLGSTTVDLSGPSAPFTASLTVGSLQTGQKVTATVTSPQNSTSEFATNSIGASPAFEVKQTSDNVVGQSVGSLRLAIENANASPNTLNAQGNPVPDRIFFTTGGGPFVIMPTTFLPPITDPVFIDGGAGAPSAELDGNGLNSDGLTLAPNSSGDPTQGSAGSTIWGLVIRNFGGAGISVQSNNNAIGNNFLGTDVSGTNAGPGNQFGVQIINNASGNTIGGTATGEGNTIGFNLFDGILVSSGSQNFIRQNLYVGTNGPSAPANDIMLASGANNDQPAPQMIGASLSGNQLLVQFKLFGAVGSQVDVELYELIESGNPAERSFLPLMNPTPQPPFTLTSSSETFEVTFTTPASFQQGTKIIATATIAANGTSQFSPNSVTAASPLAVVTTADNGDNTAPIVGSLRAAILTANSTAGPNTITFDIPQTDPGFSFFSGLWIIQLATPLPPITDPVVINGTTQPGYTNQTPSAPFVPLFPLIQISNGFHFDPTSGFDVPDDGDGLTLGPKSGGSQILGLNIVNFTGSQFSSGAGIHIESNGNTIAGDWLGVNATYTYDYLGNFNGVLIDHGASGNTIGLPGIYGRNVISGNNSDGILIQGGGSNQIQNTYVGADFYGNLITDQFLSFNLYNVGNGINIQGSSNNTIGAPIGTIDSFNVVSGNFGSGIIVQGIVDPSSGTMITPSANNVILGNRIGTDASGHSSNEFMGNLNDGILIENASGTRVGFDGASSLTYAPNITSGNFGNGISILNSTMTAVAGNFIGTDLLGLTSNAQLGNNLDGVLVENSTQTTVGGLTAADSNVISGNIKAGVRIDVTDASRPAGNNVIEGNKIGTTSTGNSDLGNGSDGVDIINSSQNTVGGTVAGAQNIITGNNGNGVLISGPGATKNIVLGNIIGARTAPSQTLGNAFNGVSLVDAVDNTIGGVVPSASGVNAAANIITSNGFGSFARTQLTASSRRPNPNNLKSYFTDSLSSVAAGTFASDLSMLAATSDSYLSDSTLTERTGETDVILYGTDPTGLNNETDRVRLTDPSFSFGPSTLPPLIPGLSLPPLSQGQSYHFFVYTGRFLPAAGSSASKDDLLLTATVVDPNGAPVPNTQTMVYIFKLGDSGSVPMFPRDNNGNLEPPELVITLDGTLSALTIGRFTPTATQNAVDEFVVAENVGGATHVVLYAQSPSNPDGPTRRTELTDITSSLSNRGPFSSLVSANLDGQNGDDLAIATIGGHQSLAQVAVYLNDGRGAFSGGISIPLAGTGITTPVAVGAGQVDLLSAQGSKNPLDLVVVDAPAGSKAKAYVFIGQVDASGNLTYSYNNANYTLSGTNPTTVLIGDFEGTGLNDVAILDAGWTPATVSAAVPGEVTLLSAVGDGTFRTPTNFDVGLLPTSLVIQLIPGQTSPSLAVSNNLGLSGTIAPNTLQVNLRQLSARRSNGIAVTGDRSDGNAIQGNLIGVDVQGNEARGNANDGILFDYSPASGTRSGNIVGGTVQTSGRTYSAGNVISGNNGDGIRLSGRPAEGAANDLIAYNLIGTDLSGESVYDPLGRPIGNNKNGIELQGLGASIIGNVTTGNGINGIDIGRYQGIATSGATVTALIASNVIGLDASKSRSYTQDGLSPLGNVLNGISLDNVVGVTIGGTTDADRNIISGNLGRGIQIREDGLSSGTSYAPNWILGNLVGIGVQTDPATSQLVAVSQQVVNGKPLSLGNLSEGIFLLDVGPSPTYIGLQAPSSTYSVISNNRGYGIHAVGSTNLTIKNNIVGASFPSATGQVPMGNGADGIFLDTVQGSATGGVSNPTTEVSGNLISGNRGDGLRLLDTSNLTVTGNIIGLGSTEASTDGSFGNSGNGISVNTSANPVLAGGNIIGGTTISARNVVSNNLGYGILVGGAGDNGNQVQGNYIGVGRDGATARQNHVSGIIILDSSNNTIGGSTDGARNVISGNGVYGVQIEAGSTNNQVLGNLIGTSADGVTPVGNGSDGLLLNGAEFTEIAHNMISGNLGNGVFIVNARFNTVGGAAANAPSNVISGNAIDGVHIFGQNSTQNTVTNNYIGLDTSGKAPLPNLANGVLLENTGPGNLVGPGNIISGNLQSGIMMISSTGSGGNLVIGNKIGTDAAGASRLANRGNGVFIFGSKGNMVGGDTGSAGPGTSPGNLISGNAQSGVVIFSPNSQVPADENQVLGNLIGTDAGGEYAIPNNADGVQIINASNNSIGGSSAGARNVISGNLASGVEIDALAISNSSSSLNSTGNLVTGNSIGTRADGSAALDGSNQQIGVLLSNVSGNLVGRSGGATSPGTNVPVPQQSGNVISGNKLAGIDVAGSSSANAVQGNFIGVSASGLVGPAAANLGNPIGVLIDNTTGNTIGGDSAGAGNLIAQSPVAGSTAALVGIQIQGPPSGPAGNVVQGNLIGIDLRNQPAANQFGVQIVNSSGNSIGGLTGDPIGGTASGIVLHRGGNIISGNALAGVNIVGQLSLSNQILGNFIGTDVLGSSLIYGNGAISSAALGQQIHKQQVQSPRDPNSYLVSPTQLNGVLINQASSNTVGPGNLISGNRVGVNIQGAAGDSTKGASNVVSFNKIGTDPGGMNPVPNFEYGVYISGSPSNSVTNNQISANGVAGIEIFGGGPQNATTAPTLRNSITGNTIGGDIGGNPVFSTASRDDMVQHHPVILIPTPDNPADPTQRNVPASDLPAYLGLQLHGVVVIGSSGNLIGQQGQDNKISGNVLTGIYITKHDFFGNTYAQPSNNTVQSNTIANNGMYGVYRYDAPEASNMVVQSGPAANRLSGSPIAIADFVTGVSNLAPPQPNPQSKLVPSGFGIPVNPFAQATGSSGSGTRKGTRGGKRKPPHKVKHPTPKPTKHHVQRPVKHTTPRPVRNPAKAHTATVSRPRIPALMDPGKTLIQVSHPAIKRVK